MSISLDRLLLFIRFHLLLQTLYFSVQSVDFTTNIAVVAIARLVIPAMFLARAFLILHPEPPYSARMLPML